MICHTRARCRLRHQDVRLYPSSTSNNFAFFGTRSLSITALADTGNSVYKISAKALAELRLQGTYQEQNRRQAITCILATNIRARPPPINVYADEWGSGSDIGRVCACDHPAALLLSLSLAGPSRSPLRGTDPDVRMKQHDGKIWRGHDRKNKTSGEAPAHLEPKWLRADLQIYRSLPWAPVRICDGLAALFFAINATCNQGVVKNNRRRTSSQRSDAPCINHTCTRTAPLSNVRTLLAAL